MDKTMEAIGNLTAFMQGRDLNIYQKADARKELDNLLNSIKELKSTVEQQEIEISDRNYFIAELSGEFKEEWSTQERKDQLLGEGLKVKETIKELKEENERLTKQLEDYNSDLGYSENELHDQDTLLKEMAEALKGITKHREILLGSISIHDDQVIKSKKALTKFESKQ